MEKVYDKCCGIDVHKKLIVACFKCGKKQEVREFGATTRKLLKLTDWLGSAPRNSTVSRKCWRVPISSFPARYLTLTERAPEASWSSIPSFLFLCLFKTLLCYHLHFYLSSKFSPFQDTFSKIPCIF